MPKTAMAAALLLLFCAVMSWLLRFRAQALFPALAGAPGGDVLAPLLLFCILAGAAALVGLLHWWVFVARRGPFRPR